jgi:hypothetical protein
MRRATGLPCTVEVLHHNMLTDFSRTIGGIVVFVPGEDSASGVLRILHSVQSYPGAPGVSPDRMKTFCLEGDVSGVDIATAALDEQQFAITVDVVLPGSVDRMLQLLVEEPPKDLFGPYTATNVNARTTKARSMAYIPYAVMGFILGEDVPPSYL